MAEVTDRPMRFRSAGYEADVYVERGRKVDGHSREGRRAIEAAGAVVFGKGADRIARGSASNQPGGLRRGKS